MQLAVRVDSKILEMGQHCTIFYTLIEFVHKLT